MALRSVVALGAAALLYGGVARAQDRRFSLETTASVGWGIMAAGRFDRSAETGSTNGGPGFGVTLALRSPYYLIPWVEFGGARLYRSTLRVEEAGVVTTGEASINTRAVVFGPAIDVWRLRFGLGMGFYNLGVSATLNGQSLSSSEWDMGYSFMIGGRILTYGRFRLGLQVRGLLISEAEINTVSLLLDLGFDAIRW